MTAAYDALKASIEQLIAQSKAEPTGTPDADLEALNTEVQAALTPTTAPVDTTVVPPLGS
ncbi:MAG: hypothetical protein ACYDD1_04735 [Caulobacteraceae bacterium]